MTPSLNPEQVAERILTTWIGSETISPADRPYLLSAIADAVRHATQHTKALQQSCRALRGVLKALMEAHDADNPSGHIFCPCPAHQRAQEALNA